MKFARVLACLLVALLGPLAWSQAAPAAAPAPGELKLIDLGEGVELALSWIPPGEFDMGSADGPPEERPVHRVIISKGFWLGRYEVTQAQWQAVGAKMNYMPQVGPKMPVERVNRANCLDFAERLTARFGKLAGGIFRLPTEAEWEYACRAGTQTTYHSGITLADLDRVGWTRNNTDTGHAGGELAPNAWNLYDMHGNFWEWCLDGKRVYTAEPVTDPRGPAPTILDRTPAEHPEPPPPAVGSAELDIALDLPKAGPPPVPAVLRGGWWLRPPERSRAASRWFLVGGGFGGGRSMRILLEPIPPPAAALP